MAGVREDAAATAEIFGLTHLPEIIVTKFILYCFEEMLGLNINYDKSEVSAVGLEVDRVANMLNCHVRSFPMKYLGLPICPDKVLISDLMFLLQKLERRLGVWKSNPSSGGRDILINSCLSAIPSYTMGFYLLPKGIHLKMYKIMSRFYWAGVGRKRKYHMMRWEHLCSPKEFGRLGFTETRSFNIVLLGKWIWKLRVR